MNNRKSSPSWVQQPNEPSPAYVAFALYCSLGPNRDRIITTNFGSQLWELLMAATGSIPQNTPLLLVCSQTSALLKLLLREDIVEHLDPNGKADARLKQFHARLHNDEQILAALETMLSTIENLERGQGLSRLPDQSHSQVLADVETFLKNQLT